MEEKNIFEQMKEVRTKLPEIAPKLFQIRTKAKGIIPFTPSEAQSKFWTDPDVGSDIILKARQLGISTMTVIEFLAYAMFIEGFNAAIISEDRDKTKKLLFIARLAFNTMPKEYQIPRDHTREDYIVFKPPPEGTGSSLYIGTAGTSHFGRGDTIHAAHCSELGLWAEAEELLNGLEEAVPLQDGSILRIESTAFGIGNHFHKLCMRAMEGRGGRYRFHFFPWWYAIDDEYKIPLKEGEQIVPTEDEKELEELAWKQYQFKITDEHLKWRRTKIDAKGFDNFNQEYPENPDTCFLATGNAVFYGISKQLLGTVKRLRAQEPLYETMERGMTIKIWKRSKKGEVYFIVVDTSEGSKKSSAFDAITVWRMLETGAIEQVVTAFGRVDSNSLAHEIVELSEDYNSAFIAVERANTGFSILDKLLDAQEQYGYELYHMIEYDQEAGKSNKVPGWRPTKQSKAAAIGKFEEMFKLGECIVYDPEVLSQALSYQRNPNTGIAEPPEGSFDDLLRTAMIACYISEDIPSESQFDVVDIKY